MNRIYLEKDLFGREQTVPVFKGDKWSLRCRLGSDSPGLPFDEKDLTGHSVTGFFPASDGDTIAVSGTITTPTSGRVTFDLPAEDTETALETRGTDFYCVIEDGDGNQTTYQTANQELEIKERGFTSI